jgi:hypothetical protein
MEEPDAEMVEEGERINYNRHFIEQDNGLWLCKTGIQRRVCSGGIVKAFKTVKHLKDKTAPRPFSLTNKERKEIIITLYSKYILL